MRGTAAIISEDFRREKEFAFTVTERTVKNKKAAKRSRKRKEKGWRGMGIY